MLKTFFKQFTKYKIKGATIKSPFKTAPYSYEILKEVNLITLPLYDHKNRTYKTTLKENTNVKKGDVIAFCEKDKNSVILSSIDGKITKISNKQITIKPNKTEFEFSNNKYIKPNLNNYSSKEIINILKENNIQGLAGALFPAYKKAQDKNIQHVILNGVECEPVNTCNKALMINNLKEILAGGLILQKATNAKDVTIVVKSNQKQIIKHIKQVIKDNNEFKNIKIGKVPNIFPAGYAKHVIRFVFNCDIKISERSSNRGFLVNNVETCFSIYRAFNFNEPQVERLISIVGENVNKPKNILAPIGTHLEDILNQANINKSEVKTIRLGGLMMGKFLKKLDFKTPILKNTSSIILNMKQPEKTADCINCGKCVQSCPLGLKPNKMIFAINNKDINDKNLDFLEVCINCNLCNYLCPSNINVTEKLKEAKKIKIEFHQQEEHSEYISTLIEKKATRIKKEKAEKEEKRKQRVKARKNIENE